MNNKLLFLIKNSLNKKWKSKWFKIVNVLICILIIGLINIDSIINFFGGDFNDKLEIIILDKTNEVGKNFKDILLATKKDLDQDTKIEVKSTTKKESQLKKKLDDKILVIIDSSDTNYLKAKIISVEKIDITNYQIITNTLATVKYNYGLTKSNIDPLELKKLSEPIDIERVVLNDSKNTEEDNMEIIMGTVFPTVILPFFMLIVFLVQMIGAEIYEEKSTRSMEVIISNVSPKTHFMSKVIAVNTFAITQGILLFIYGALAFLIKNQFGDSSMSSLTGEVVKIWNTLVANGFVDKLIYIIPLSLILLIFSFIAYSLVAGILASMTVNMEDYQQIQTPIMLILAVAYYLAIMASMFNGSIFIKVLSYVPFISSLLSPALLVLGQISILDVIISIIILALFNFIIIKWGLKIYKEGILNYSNEKVWTKLRKTISSKSSK